jgi:hypothetical protein
VLAGLLRGLTLDAAEGAEFQKYTVVLIWMIVALSSTVLTGWAGQLSLGQFAFVENVHQVDDPGLGQRVGAHGFRFLNEKENHG